MTIDETLNEDSPVYNLFYQVTDPRTNMPALTTLMYKVCKNDPVRFDEATKIVALFMLAAYEKGKEKLERDLEQAQTYAEELENDVFALRIALADAIRRPMGVVPASAEGLISLIDLDAAEERRVKGKNQ